MITQKIFIYGLNIESNIESKNDPSESLLIALVII